TGGGVQSWHEKMAETDDTYLVKLLQRTIASGYHVPEWVSSQLAYAIGKSSPALAAALGLGAAGGAAGTAAGGPVGAGFGATAGAVTGFAAVSFIQELAPAYQRARADGLSHEEAVNRAWLLSGVAGATAAAM